MRKTITILVILFFALLCFKSSLSAEALKAATAEWKPYAIQTGDGFKGISVDILKEVAKRTGDTISIELYPAPRLNKYFDANKIDINFADSLYWNKVNAPPTYIFTDSYLFVKEYVYSLAADGFEIKRLEDLYGKTVGITRGYYYSMVEDAFDNGLVIKEKANTDEILFKKFINRPSILIFMDEFSFNFLVNKFNCDRKIFKQGLQLTYAPLGMKIRIEKKYLIKRFNKAIDEMREDGTIQKIIAGYTSAAEM